MNVLSYMIQVNLYLTLFYLFYFLLLRSETFFVYNRIYLLLTASMAMLIPIAKLDWLKHLLAGQKVQQISTAVIYEAGPIVYNQQITAKWTSYFELINVMAIIYSAGLTFFLIRFVLGFTHISSSKISTHNAFSFFNKIVVDKELPGKEIILKHEYVHVKQVHSADVIFFELLSILHWFNPAAYCYKRAIKSIHEFIADEITTRNVDKAEYANLLLNEALGVEPLQLANSFFNQSLLKTRIIMLNKTKSRKVAILKYGLSAPLFVGMLVFSSVIAKAGEFSRAFDRSVSSTEKQLNKSSEITSVPNDKALVKPLRSDEKEYTINREDIEERFGTVKVIGAVLKELSLNINDSVYSAKELSTQPGFPGGIEAFYQFVGKTFIVPKEALANVPRAKIIVNFVIETDGSLTDIKTLRDPGFGTGEEVIRVLKLSPKWSPGLIAGKAVRVSYVLPISIDNGAKSTGNVKEIVTEGDAAKAYYILNGKPISYEDMKKIDQKRIESISVIKGGEKMKEYGAPADATGVILIKLKESN